MPDARELKGWDWGKAGRFLQELCGCDGPLHRSKVGFSVTGPGLTWVGPGPFFFREPGRAARAAPVAAQVRRGSTR